MKKIFSLLTLLFILASVGVFAQVQPAPSLLNFQGRLAKPDGTPVSNGTYSVRLSLWTAATAGTEKWNQTVNPVTVRNGTFAVLLNVAAPADLFNTNLWLEIKIGTNSPLTPRQQVVSVAFAMKANTVSDNAITSAKIADGTITSADIANGTIAATDLAAGLLDFWKLAGNAGTTASHFLGTTDNKPLILKANNRQVMRFEEKVDAANTYHTVNVQGGSSVNTIASGVLGATIAGGGQDNNSGGDSPNDIRGNFGTISGGSGNLIDAFTFAVIGGGEGNIVQGNHAVIAGGSGNNIQSADSVIGGGLGNYLFGQYGTIAGGLTNQVTAPYAAIGGGFSNFVSGEKSVIGGGSGNQATNDFAAIGGGDSNIITGGWATIGGGLNNTASSFYATVGGGVSNTASFNEATVGGGFSNEATGQWATVGGGYDNSARGASATVPGGASNEASGVNSFAAGYRAKAESSGSFVWADSQDSDFYDFGPDTFNIRTELFHIDSRAPETFSKVQLRTGSNQFGFQQTDNSIALSTYVGSGAGWIGTTSNHPLALYSSNVAKMTLFPNGNVSIGYGLSGVSYPLTVNGTIYCTGFINASDARYKKNIATLDNPLHTLLNLRGVSFDWNKEAHPQMHFSEGRQMGFIAQEVEQVLPELVSTDEQGYKSVNYVGVVPVLVEAVRTLKTQKDAEVKTHQEEIAGLKAELEALKAAVRQLQAQNKTGITNKTE